MGISILVWLSSLDPYWPSTPSRANMGVSGWWPGQYGNAHVLICIYILLYSQFHLFTLKYNRIRLFRIISIPSIIYFFRPLDHVISMECKHWTSGVNVHNKNSNRYVLSTSWKENGPPLYISDIRQIVGYRTPVFIQPFLWRLHITIIYNLPHLRLWYADVVTVIA